MPVSPRPLVIRPKYLIQKRHQRIRTHVFNHLQSLFQIWLQKNRGTKNPCYNAKHPPAELPDGKRPETKALPTAIAGSGSRIKSGTVTRVEALFQIGLNPN